MKTCILAVTWLFLSVLVKAQPNPKLPVLKLEPFAKGFAFPIDLANAGDSRLFIAERLGKIWAIDSSGNKLTDQPFLDITDKVYTVFPDEYDERGLLGLAFHPNFPDSPYFYVNYTGLDKNSHIARFMVNPDNPNKALKHSQVILLTVGQPPIYQFSNHKAGCLKFGPDGYLYGTIGDGGLHSDPFNNSQNLRNLLGKVFRIDVNKPDSVRGKRYTVPSDNPYVNVDKAKDEIWASGLRNPFRFSFDREIGTLWLPDVGQNKWEEINVQPAGSAGGQNYGWSCYESNHKYKGDTCDYNGEPYTFPIAEYKHPNDNCASITGGFVYRGSKYPKMWGKYFYCDYCTGKFSTVLQYNDTWLNIFLYQGQEGAYVSFGESTDGELYVADHYGGNIYHLIDASEKISGITSSGPDDASQADFNLKLYPNPNRGQFTIEINAYQKESYLIKISNLYGQTILLEEKDANIGLNRWTMASAKLQKGVYMLSIQTSKGSVSRTFVVE